MSAPVAKFTAHGLYARGEAATGVVPPGVGGAEQVVVGYGLAWNGHSVHLLKFKKWLNFGFLKYKNPQLDIPSNNPRKSNKDIPII